MDDTGYVRFIEAQKLGVPAQEFSRGGKPNDRCVGRRGLSVWLVVAVVGVATEGADSAHFGVSPATHARATLTSDMARELEFILRA
jgi:hypothetical protein